MDNSLLEQTNGSSPGVILEALVERLLQSTLSGPAMNARPHHSRQRVDLVELAALGNGDMPLLLRELMSAGSRDLPALVAPFEWPSRPRDEWPAATEVALANWRSQQALMGKLRNLAADAVDYHGDHGENALAIGFPLLSVPPRRVAQGGNARILAPLAFLPLSMQVRGGGRPGIGLSLMPDGPGRLVANEMLIAFLERETGKSLGLDECDDDPEDPWQELHEIIRRIATAAAVGAGFPAAWDGLLTAVPRLDDLPAEPCLLPAAVMGLFPMHNSGVLRDLEWMQDHASTITLPTSLFLSARALAASVLDDGAEIPPELRSTATAAQDESRLVAPADPSQAAAVWRARSAGALVVHGPPGTGKSQTIANIIGDHLARGERVLFVSDKRTALDVVKHRLDSLGIGHLCGVVHDAAADRHTFYRVLRQRLDELPELAQGRDCSAEWEQLQELWTTTRAKLAACCNALHDADDTGVSFHELVGQWLMTCTALTDGPATGSGWPEGYDLATLGRHRAALEELLRRALRAGFANNPWRDWPVMAPEAVAAVELRRAGEALAQCEVHAQLADAAWNDAAPLLGGMTLRWDDFAQAVRELRDSALDLGDVALMADAEVCGRYASADPAMLRAYVEQAERLSGAVVALTETPLDPALFSALPEAESTLTTIQRRLASVRKWSAARGVRKWLRFLHAGGARRALQPLGLELNEVDASRGLGFYQALQLRLSLHHDLGGSVGAMPADDALAQGWRVRRMLAGVLFRFLPGELLADGGKHVRATLAQPAQIGRLVQQLEAAAMRLDAGAQWCRQALACRMFADAAMPGMVARVLHGADLGGQARAWCATVETVPDVARIHELLDEMPPALAGAASCAGMAEMSWDVAQPVFQAAALARSIRDRLAANPLLTRLDADAIESGLAGLRELAPRRRELVRQRICQTWLRRQRDRLLAGTGTRMGPVGAALRQRLFIRGVHALRMRSMIAAGAGTEGGDPLFDLCPVWMASPATVAQIMPREALFDVVIFDEASQCRLEETLPVLLRAKRVVIAGDTQQLPPTRFFESALQELEDSVIEDADDLFEKRQIGAEDLLSAALNVEVDEVFLDVHYRSRHEALIQYSNRAFYQSRLQIVPAVLAAGDASAPIVLHEVMGTYRDRTNPSEAERVVDLIAALLGDPVPPSVGVACFNLTQRDLILDVLDDRAERDAGFARVLAVARARQGDSTFEGLFVRNLENVQGDERDVIIISTTFGADEKGVFRRHFGVLNRPGGGRRLNVLVTRARRQVHVVTSIPRTEYAALAPVPAGALAGGRYHLYAYLAYAARLAEVAAIDRFQPPGPQPAGGGVLWQPLAGHLRNRLPVQTAVQWGSEGLCMDVAFAGTISHGPISGGVLVDFSRYARAGDVVAWDLFRSDMLVAAGWNLQRVWTTDLFRRHDATLTSLVDTFMAGGP